VPGIITLLDEPYASRIEDLWEAMEREFGVARGYPGAIPHFSYHLAETYDIEAAEMVVAAIAMAERPFEVETSGFGVFTGPAPVVYIPVARSPELAALHALICDRMRRAGTETVGYYLPERALLHITIAQQNVPPDALPALLGWLARRDLSWRMPVSNLAIADQTADGAAVLPRFPLRGR
jgi:2'-5' RNA ligase